MVVFVDLETDNDNPLSIERHLKSPRGHVPPEHIKQLNHEVPDAVMVAIASTEDQNGRCFASALGCYPLAASLASYLDLNDLYSLSRTCRRVRGSLNQFAHQLRTQSLRCIHDEPLVRSGQTRSEQDEDEALKEAINASLGLAADYTSGPAYPLPIRLGPSHSHWNHQSALGLRGKIGQCARDLVAPCRKCGTVVCRNCAAKAPSDKYLSDRFRRLCSTCLDVPLADHMKALPDQHDCHDSPPASSASSARSVQTVSSTTSSLASSSGQYDEPAGNDAVFTSPAFLRHPCTCASAGVYLCQPCGQNLHAADVTYQRVWTWRSRYSTHIGGGLGTGLGLGNQGQKCGRGESCLEPGAAGVCWVEIECSEARAQGRGRDSPLAISRSSTPMAGDVEHEIVVNKPGYLSQEMEGIGGVVKKKVKKRVKVGATVYEYDDERESSKYLEREVKGRQRSWCGWCSRVCPSSRDMDEAEGSLQTVNVAHV